MPSVTPAPAQARESARQLKARGEERLRFGDLNGAREALSQALALDGSPAETHYALGNCLRRLGLTVEAEAAFEAALERDPKLHPAWFGLCFLYQETGRTPEAAENLRLMVKQFGDQRDLLHQIGGLMADFGQYTDAVAVYEDLLKAEPQARNYQRLGQYYQKLGRYQEAAAAFQQAIERNPDSGPAYLLLAHTRRFNGGAEDAALAQRFSDALQRPDLGTTSRVCLHFSLGKLYDDMGRYDQAFAHFEQGNRLRRTSEHFDVVFDHTGWQNFVRQVQQLDSGALAPLGKPDSTGPAPLFIVGMLRSGTTLAERILASHPRVHGLGETAWLDNLLRRVRMSADLPYPANLAQLTDDQFVQLRNEYTLHWPKHAGNAIYMVDKNPTNFMYLGLIARVFPDARIIHCQRDARDTCLSVYFQNFAHPHNSYAYDLEEIGQYYNGYVAVMQRWRELLPRGMLHELRYEELVADQEKVTRALLEALDLPWDARCLEFHAQTDKIATASVWQARQPLYNLSVGRWRHYQQYLGPLLKTLVSG